MAFDVADYTRDFGQSWFFIMRAEGLLADDHKLLDVYCYIP